MNNVIVALNILESGENIPFGYSRLSDIIFDMKLDLTLKGRLVANGHLTPDPVYSIYTGMVSHKSVRVALTYAALMCIYIWVADIMSAYVQAPTTEKYYVDCGPELGNEHSGKRTIVKRALCEIKSSGRGFRNHLRDCMDHMCYTSSLTDLDL